MKYNIIVLIVIVFTCVSKDSNKDELLVLDFLNDLKENHSVEELLKKHFVFNTINNDDEMNEFVVPLYSEFISRIRKVQDSNADRNDIEVVRYQDKNDYSLKFGEIVDDEAIYLVLLDGELWFPILVKDNKLSSIVTVTKSEKSEMSSFVRF